MSLSVFSKDKLVFDTSAPADSDNIGAYIRSSDGTLIDHVTIATINRLAVDSTLKDGAGTDLTSTLVSGKQGLDVNVINSQVINVDINGIYDGVTNLTPANVGLIGSSRAAPGLANQTLQFTGGGVNSDAVSPSNIVAQDVNSFMMGWNGTGWDRIKSNSGSMDVNITGVTGGAITVNQGTSPWVVSGTVNSVQSGTWTVGLSEDHNYGAVGANTLRTAAQIGNATGAADFGAGATSAQTLRVVLPTDQSAIPVTQSGSWTMNVTGNVADDAVDSGNPLKVGSRAVSGPLAAISAANDRADLISDLYRRVYVNNGSNIAVKNQAVAVNNVGEVALPASSLGGRRTLMVQNLSNKEIYVGATGVSNANSLVVAARATISLDLGPDVSLFALGSAASQDIRVFEMA